MKTKKIKTLLQEYVYEELGFPILLKDVPLVQERGYEYPLINHNRVMLQAAFSLVTNHQRLDGARLKFVRKFMHKSLDQFADILGDVSKSTIHGWEKEKTKICPLTNEKIRKVYLALRNEIVTQVRQQLDNSIIKEFLEIGKEEEIPPLTINENGLLAI